MTSLEQTFVWCQSSVRQPTAGCYLVLLRTKPQKQFEPIVYRRRTVSDLILIFFILSSNVPLTLAPLGGGCKGPPLVFSQIAPEVLEISLWNLPYLSGQFHTLCQKIRSQVIGQPWVTSCSADFDQHNGFTGITTTGAILKVVCRLALTIWSYWHGCREQIFLNISNASNSMETP